MFARFRTMAIARAAVLAGHVLGSVVQPRSRWRSCSWWPSWSASARRPGPSPGSCRRPVGTAGLAVGWLSVGIGLVTGSVETASNLPMILTLLVLLSSASCRATRCRRRSPGSPSTSRSRRSSRRSAAALGTPIGDSALVAVAWCVGITVLGYVWAVRLNEDAQRPAAAWERGGACRRRATRDDQGVDRSGSGEGMAPAVGFEPTTK